MTLDPSWSPERRHVMHRTRLPVLRSVAYACGLMAVGGRDMSQQSGSAMTVNMSAGGMCILMDWAPEIREVLSVRVDQPLPIERLPPYAEVRWIKAIPLRGYALCFVGLKILE